jgi:RNA polymerase sigma-70 factor (sigma-E family)
MIDDFSDYVRAERGSLYREAFRLCRDRHEADDLTQDTLIKVFRRWERLPDGTHLAGYVRRTLLNSYLSTRRRLRWTFEVTRAELPERAVDEPAREDGIALRSAVRHLAPRQRAVIALRFWVDLSVEDTAAALGCSLGTVKSQTHRALGTLRLTLAPGCPEG